MLQKRRKYQDGEIIGHCKLITMLPSKTYGTKGRKVGMGLFECSVCGKPFECMITSVKVGTRSCGCYAIDIASKSNTKHGMWNTKEYRTWLGVKTRCFNEKDKHYKHWGGRGIKMHEDWVNSFDSFFSYVGYSPSPKHSLDRIDNNGDYEPGNVRWATPKEQSRNKRDNRLLCFKGETKTMMEWSEITGVPFSVIQGRSNRGWCVDDIFNKPVTLSYMERHGVRFKIKK